MKADIFEEITAHISGQLDQGVRPWSKPWTNKAGSFDFELPHNAAGRAYRGANVFWLWVIAQSRGYSTHTWMTYKQATEFGGNVKKGEKGSDVILWLFPSAEDKKKAAEKGEREPGPRHKTYKVFNLDQTEGVKLPNRRKAVERSEPERIADAEAVIAATGAVIGHGGNRAFYMPAADRVQLPERDQFMSVDGYYSVAFHELGHWTGHTSRLNREFGKRFGDNAYAFEELVAELTSALVCGSQGFASIDRPDHAEYIGHWLEVMKGDKRAFNTAASAAQKAADVILKTSFAKAEEAPAEPTEEAAAIAMAA